MPLNFFSRSPRKSSMASVSLEVALLGAAKSDADADAAAAVAVLLVEEYGGLVGGRVGIADTD
jgi:hypothetical protein